MEAKKLTYFEWRDIQKEICSEMGIDVKYFRNYNKLIGGGYKDLWHEWMEYFSEVQNDHIIPCEMSEIIESKIEWVTEDKKEWLVPFIEAIYRVWDKYEITHVRYFW